MNWKKTFAIIRREYVERILRAHGGSVTKAAKASGVALRYFRLVKARSQR